MLQCLEDLLHGCCGTVPDFQVAHPDDPPAQLLKSRAGEPDTLHTPAVLDPPVPACPFWMPMVRMPVKKTPSPNKSTFRRTNAIPGRWRGPCAVIPVGGCSCHLETLPEP